MASSRMLSRVPPPTGARLPVGAPVAGRAGVFQSPPGSGSAYTMNVGAPPRAFSGAPPPPAAPTPAAPIASAAPGQPDPDGSIDLLKYGQEAGIQRPGTNSADSATPTAGGDIDMLAFGRSQGIPRPGEMSGLTPVQPGAMVQQQPAPPPPPPPQTERVNPLSGDNSKVVPGQSTSFTPPPTPGYTNMSPIARMPDFTGQPKPLAHVGGEGSYMRQFSNPQSAGIYDSYVKGLFGGANPSPVAKSPLSRSPAQPAYAGM